tara:strand:- start:1394 stop:2623 length:1230 start_codon:yes stop_codon:yes gene_type:complete
MKNSNELREERSAIIEKLEVIKNVAEAEERDLTSDENSKVDELIAQTDEFDAKIKRAEKMEETLKTAAKVSGTKIERKIDKDLEKFTFGAAIRAAYTGKKEGIVAEMHDEAVNEARYTGQEFKGVGIPASILTRANTNATDVSTIEVGSFTDQLEANLVLASAGANFYGGVNSLKLPVFSGIDSTWVSEDGTSGTVSTNGTTSNVTLTPKKLISVVNMSAESMMQNSGLEAALQRNMAQNIAATMELALLGDADITNAPTSIFNDAATQSVAGAAPTIAEILNMESTLITNGVNLEGARMAWLLDGGALTEAKTLAQVSSVSPAYDNFDKRFCGYYAFVSSNVGGTSGSGTNYLLGDFSKVHVAQFGGLDILFDPYTNAATGLPRMVVTSLADGDAVQNDTAFVKIANA